MSKFNKKSNKKKKKKDNLELIFTIIRHGK